MAKEWGIYTVMCEVCHSIIVVNKQNHAVQPVNKMAVLDNPIKTKINFTKFVKKESGGLIYRNVGLPLQVSQVKFLSWPIKVVETAAAWMFF
jgi:hypothetical protein